MATSQVQVVNLALTKLGQDRVISISDDVEAARVIRSLWDLTVDVALADYPWKFATLRTTLPALADAPPFGWSLQYLLPDSCLRLIQVSDDWVFYTQDTPFFALEGGADGGQYILTNEAAPLQVRYVQRVTNVGLWPPLFARSVAMMLAADASEKLTQSTTKGEKAVEEYALTIKKAMRQSAIELPPAQLPESSWLAARGD